MSGIRISNKLNLINDMRCGPSFEPSFEECGSKRVNSCSDIKNWVECYESYTYLIDEKIFANCQYNDINNTCQSDYKIYPNDPGFITECRPLNSVGLCDCKKNSDDQTDCITEYKNENSTFPIRINHNARKWCTDQNIGTAGEPYGLAALDTCGKDWRSFCKWSWR